METLRALTTALVGSLGVFGVLALAGALIFLRFRLAEAKERRENPYQGLLLGAAELVGSESSTQPPKGGHSWQNDEIEVLYYPVGWGNLRLMFTPKEGPVVYYRIGNFTERAGLSNIRRRALVAGGGEDAFKNERIIVPVLEGAPNEVREPITKAEWELVLHIRDEAIKALSTQRSRPEDLSVA